MWNASELRASCLSLPPLKKSYESRYTKNKPQKPRAVSVAVFCLESNFKRATTAKIWQGTSKKEDPTLCTPLFDKEWQDRESHTEFEKRLRKTPCEYTQTSKKEKKKRQLNTQTERKWRKTGKTSKRKNVSFISIVQSSLFSLDPFGM